MNCPGCGCRNPDTARFCGECGATLSTTATCSSCGIENPRGQKFCNGCGQRLGGGVPSVLPGRAPRDYTPKHLADKILQSKSALEGERKQVTVLFADVKGSTELAEQVDPEEWHRILNRFFEILTDGVHRFEGTVNQYTGDGIMALFGAPIAHEGHAQRACYAALWLRDKLRAYAEELKRRKAVSFLVRMGLNSGEVIVGKIGDDLRMDYTAQGQVVNVAERVEQLATPETAYVTKHTADLVEGFFRLRDLGEFDLKGTTAPVRVYELEGIGPLRTRLDVARARGFSRFVGRENDMQTLEAALARSREAGGQVVGVVSQAGVGKSRLCYEFLERCRARDLTVLEGHAVAHGKNLPFLPILQVFRAYYGITEQDDDRTAREKIAGRLLLIDEALREALPLVFEFLGVPDPERPALRMDPEARQRQLFGVLRRLVQEGGRAEPPVTLIEDLHWMDGGSGAFLEQWVDSIGGARGLLLVNFRPEYHAEWMGKSYYQQLPLAPLGSEATRELVSDLLGDHPSTDGLAEAIHARTAGNPFFIEEVVQSLIESEHLTGTRGSYRLVPEIAALEIPPTVQSVLAARIDRLAEREKHVLQAAAVIGKKFAEPVLEAVAELPAIDLAASLRALTGAEFLYEQSLYPLAEYAFKHPLTQEVAYGSQLGERRARLHVSVARAIEELDADKLDERSALLAHHWEESGEPLAAARWHRRAAEWVGVSNFLQAVAHWEKVRTLAANLPEDREALEHRLVACQRWLGFVGRVGASEEDMERIFAEGKAIAEKLEDPTALFQLYGGLVSVLVNSGLVTQAFEVAERAYELGSDATDLGIRVWSRDVMLDTAFWLADLQPALRWADELLEMAGDDTEIGLQTRGFPIRISALGFRGALKAQLGMLEKGRRDVEQAVRLGRDRGHWELTSWALADLCWIDELTGEFDDTLGRTQQALEYADRGQSPYTKNAAHQKMGLAHLLRGDPREALEFLERAYRFRCERRTGLEAGPADMADLAAANLSVGNTARARTLVEEALAFARRGGAWHRGARVYLVRAQALRESGGRAARDEIEATLARADALICEKGARAWAPFVCEERARLAQCLDDAAAEQHLREAHRLYVEMGATGHAERLARELGL